ncbi:MAG: phosphopentomutase [Thermoanaerobacteraceae bacterium]|nr:phosphopentomutase [Thermoanaerobacteraceae bacterium]
MGYFKRIILIVLDSVGIGELPDANLFGDKGSDTLGHICEVTGVELPNMGRLGLGNIRPLKSVPPVETPIGFYGKMAEKSAGKDTTTGHWEIAGVWLNKPFPTYPDGFPEEIISIFEKRIGTKVLGNKAASGTEIIKELGERHIETGYPIVYTSADSVFQIAAHEDIIPLERLYEMCRIAREIMMGDHAVGRIIARPFTGTPGNFVRTEHRRDFSLEPPEETVLDRIVAKGLEVYAVGKIEDIFAHRGITRSNHTGNNRDGIAATINYMNELKTGLIFTNLVDFDTQFGHRNNAKGYADALKEFDDAILEIISKMNSNDLLMITADHGCDPTTTSTDHSREYVPLLVYTPSNQNGASLGIRDTFSDIAQTIAENFDLEAFEHGKSFLGDVRGL